MQQFHKVPTHLSTPDKLIYGMNARQMLIMLIAASMGYDVWLHTLFLQGLGFAGLLLRLLGSSIPFLLGLGLAFLVIAGRSLEVWLLMVARYWHQPRRYLWRSIRYSPYNQEAEQ